jgi:DNA topoisomerase-1
MRDRHVSVKRGTLAFQFRGKSGVSHHIQLHDPRLARIVRRVQDLPGQELFQYVNERGETQDVKSEEVNAYIRAVAGDEFSAKDFRTWAGTVLAALALAQFERCDTKAQAKKNLVAAIERVAERLGNTPAVCRGSYVCPEIIHSFEKGKIINACATKLEDLVAFRGHGLHKAERALLRFLNRR